MLADTISNLVSSFNSKLHMPDKIVVSESLGVEIGIELDTFYIQK